jgi:hypothetical protein
MSELSDADRKKLRLAISEITGIKNRYQNLAIVAEELTIALAAMERHAK